MSITGWRVHFTRHPVIDMAPDDIPRTAQQRITEMGRLPRSTRRVRGRAGAAALTARRGHDGLVPRNPGGGPGAAAGEHWAGWRTGGVGAGPAGVRTAAAAACPARGACRSWGAGVAGALRGLRLPGPPRRRPDWLAVRPAPCGVGGPVCGARPDGAAGAVPVDDRPGPGAGVAVVDGGRDGGTVLQAAGGVLSRRCAVEEEVQGAGHHGGRDRRGHQVACRAPPAALWPTGWPRRAARIRGRAGRSRQAGERSAPSMPSWCSQMS